MSKRHALKIASIVLPIIAALLTLAFKGKGNKHDGLPSHAELEAALQAIVQAAQADAELEGDDWNAGLSNDMWATIVNKDGIVCAVAFSGNDRHEQWRGSRAISAQKANAAQAFSLPDGIAGPFSGLALSTANLWAATQPGGSLWELPESNPVDTGVAYRGPANRFGAKNDPMVGGAIGGVNVFGGGLGLYDDEGNLVGGIGVSGDTSCTDHIVAWKLRDALGLDNVPAGISSTGDDNIIFDLNVDGISVGGFGHPECGFGEKAIAEDLPNFHPVGP